ncbi:hypothetical protein [Arthrobacter cheniae]|uniref:hypothetical protein n=1 Tax=Arthrobacter cheniae TaxID=1258888 RepID=UPI001C7DE8FA
MYEQQDMTVEQIGQVLGVSRTIIYRTLRREQATPTKGRRPKVQPPVGEVAALTPQEAASPLIDPSLDARL